MNIRAEDTGNNWLDDEGDSEEISRNNTQKLRNFHYKNGYIQGIEEGKKLSIQKGFDRGYKEAAQLAIQIGIQTAKNNSWRNINSYKDLESHPILFNQIKNQSNSLH